MAWTLVQQSAAETLGAGAKTLPAGSTAGNLLIATIGAGSGTAVVPPAGWVTAGSISAGAASEVYVFAYFNNPGGLSSFTFTGGGGSFIGEVSEWTCPGVPAVAAASDTGTATAGAVTSLAISTAGTARAGDLVIVSAFQHITAAVITWTDPAGFTEFASLIVSSNSNHEYAAYRASAASAGVQSVTVTSSATGLALGWSGVVATFSQPQPFMYNTQQAVMTAATR